MTVTLVYFDGCPHWTTLEERLRTALHRIGSQASVERRLVETVAEAAALGFTGSPTILVDGRDPFDVPSTPPGLSCRLYRTPDGLAGSPIIDQLVEALR